MGEWILIDCEYNKDLEKKVIFNNSEGEGTRIFIQLRTALRSDSGLNIVHLESVEGEERGGGCFDIYSTLRRFRRYAFKFLNKKRVSR